VNPADALLAEVAADDLGSVSPSVYETGRLVAEAPWLDKHAERVAYLLRTQQPDGSWGAPGGYALVPTLSATEALMLELERPPVPPGGALTTAVDRGLGALFRQLRPGAGGPTPDRGGPVRRAGAEHPAHHRLRTCLGAGHPGLGGRTHGTGAAPRQPPDGGGG
jgi:hypothetical protein